MAYDNSSNPALEKFQEFIIARMEEMAKAGEDFKKQWFSFPSADIPRNLSGRAYSASNSLLLFFMTQSEGWRAPVFMTFKQAQDHGVSVKKGEVSTPVCFWNVKYYDSKGRPMAQAEVDKLTSEEKKELNAIPYLKWYRVFNVEQTTLPEVKPELFQKILDRYTKAPELDVNGMYANAPIDSLVSKNEWVCPIRVKEGSDEAFYSPSKDCITVPAKGQFRVGKTEQEIYDGGQAYYSTLLHEMAHSTGHKDRLNRLEKTRFGEPKYAKEELVAELTSAFIGQSMGFAGTISDNNAAYLNNWRTVLQEEPKFIVSLMADVDKASKMILQAVDKQRIDLGLEPINGELRPFAQKDTQEVAEKSKIYRKMDGKLAVKVPGYEERNLSSAEVSLYARMTSEKDADIVKDMVVRNTVSLGNAVKVNTPKKNVSLHV